MMSEKATNRTQELFTNILPKTIAEDVDERWDACIELAAEARELSRINQVDEQAVIEMAKANADAQGVAFGAAERVMQSTRRPNGGLAAMHAPVRKVWRGTGSSIATVDLNVVDYCNLPGEVEAKYGPAFPFIVEKLGWAAALAAERIEFQDNLGGYQRVTIELRQQGKLAAGQLQHLGSIARFGKLELNDSKVEQHFYAASVSGTLMNPWADMEYHALPYFRNREAIDEAAGLLDGFPENLRAGLYDVQFGEMVIDEMLEQKHEGEPLQVFDPKFYEGVDIN